MFTEWWDLDEPCKIGEVEAVIVSHTYAKLLGKEGRHRSCSANRINYPVEFQTIEGQADISAKGGTVYDKAKDKLICINKRNKIKPRSPYFWREAKIKCRDWKMRLLDKCNHQV